MLIPKQYPQFINERALLIVTGTEDAKLYLASNGEISKVESFRVKPPTFDSSEKSIYPLKTSGKQMHLKEFVKTVAERSKSVVGRERLHHAYLFTPSPLKSAMQEALPTTVTKVLRKTTVGNYCDLQVLGLLAMIEGKKPGKRFDA